MFCLWLLDVLPWLCRLRCLLEVPWRRHAQVVGQVGQRRPCDTSASARASPATLNATMQVVVVAIAALLVRAEALSCLWLLEWGMKNALCAMLYA